MKLISMTDFVLEQFKTLQSDEINSNYFIDRVARYAKFLKQPLTLSMFVPCDDEGNVLLGKPLSPATDEEWDRWEKEQPIYHQAKEKVLFEGFGSIVKKDGFFIVRKEDCDYWISERSSSNIEVLLKTCDFDLTLTQSAKKQIGL